MNVEQLAAIAEAYIAGLEETDLISQYGGLNDAFGALIQDNTEPNQIAFNGRLEQFNTLLSQSDPFNFKKTWANYLGAIGLDFIPEGGLAARINDTIEQHRLTPVVARDALAELLAKITSIKKAFEKVLDGFQSFHIEPASIPAGEAELAVLIPVAEIDGNLPGFAHEVRAFDHSISVISELVSGTVEPARLKRLSSIDAWIQVAASAPVVLGYLKIIAEIQSIIANTHEIRAVKAQAEAAGVRAGTVELLDKQAKDQVTGNLYDLRDRLFRLYPGSTSKREDEFEALMDRILNELATRVDNKFQYDGDIGPVTEAVVVDGEAADGEASDAVAVDDNMVAELKAVAQQVRFTDVPPTPILHLPSPQESRTRVQDVEVVAAAPVDAITETDGPAPSSLEQILHPNIDTDLTVDGEAGEETGEDAAPKARTARDVILKPAGFGKKGESKR